MNSNHNFQLKHSDVELSSWSVPSIPWNTCVFELLPIMENTSGSATAVEQCNKCHLSISLAGHSVKYVTCVRKGGKMTRNRIPLWFPVLQVFAFKKQPIKERGKNKKSKTHTKNPLSKADFWIALLCYPARKGHYSVFLPESDLYHPNSGCAEH